MLALKIWLEEQLARVSAKSVIAEAIRRLEPFGTGSFTSSKTAASNSTHNIVERGMRPIVLNRKNALFAGHDQGAENWAAIASLVETCKLHGVDPQAYFADVLTKLVNLWPASRLDELMPWAWAARRSTDRLAARAASAKRVRARSIEKSSCQSSGIGEPLTFYLSTVLDNFSRDIIAACLRGPRR